MSLNTETTDIQHNKVYNQKLLDDSLNRNDIDQFRYINMNKVNILKIQRIRIDKEYSNFYRLKK